MSKTERRSWSLLGRGNGDDDCISDGANIEVGEEIHVTELRESEVIVGRDLLQKIHDFLNEDIARLECNSRQRNLPEDEWGMLMFYRDQLEELLK